MTLTQTSDAQSGDSPAHLAATESPVLASHVNGLYTETGGGAIPHTEIKKPKRSWLQSVADWRVILATLGAPAFCAGLIWIWPTTKSDLNIVRMESSSALKIETTAIAGQIKETKAELNGKIDALAARVDARVDGIEKSQNRLQTGVDELLRRSSPYDPPQIVAASPAAPPENPQPTRRVKKKTVPVAAKPVQTGFRLW